MAESNQHILLVNNIVSYIKQNVQDIIASLLLVDLPDSVYKPQSVFNGFIPDVYYNFKEKLIIGEAKTDNDVERIHSLNQYEAYFTEAFNFDGDSIIVFSVTWRMYGTIKNIIRLTKKKNNFDKIKVIVINNKGDVSCL